MKISRQKKKHLRNSIRILFLLLNVLVILFFVSDTVVFGYRFFITLFVLIGFVLASISLFFKKKAYRVRGIPVAVFFIAGIIDLIFMVESVSSLNSQPNLGQDSAPVVPLFLLLIVNLIFYLINLSLQLSNEKKQSKYFKALLLYLLIMVIAESTSFYWKVSIPDFIIGICLFLVIGEFLVIGIKTYKKEKRKFSMLSTKTNSKAL